MKPVANSVAAWMVRSRATTPRLDVVIGWKKLWSATAGALVAVAFSYHLKAASLSDAFTVGCNLHMLTTFLPRR